MRASDTNKADMYRNMIDAVNAAIVLERNLDNIPVGSIAFDDPSKAKDIADRLSEISARLAQAAWNAQAALVKHRADSD